MWSHAMKKHLFALLYALGVTRFASWYHRKRVIFLCYHGVTQRPTRSSADPKGLHVNHRRFAAQLDLLERHYQIISLSDYLRARRGHGRLPSYSAVLTEYERRPRRDAARRLPESKRDCDQGSSLRRTYQ